MSWLDDAERRKKQEVKEAKEREKIREQKQEEYRQYCMEKLKPAKHLLREIGKRHWGKYTIEEDKYDHTIHLSLHGRFTRREYWGGVRISYGISWQHNGAQIPRAEKYFVNHGYDRHRIPPEDDHDGVTDNIEELKKILGRLWADGRIARDSPYKSYK